MQVVGMNCSRCSKAIDFASEGRACMRCNHAYHTACIQDGKICPSCGEDLEQQVVVAGRKDKGATAACLRAGRAQFVVAVVLLASLMVYNVAASLLRPQLQSLMGFNPVIGTLVTVGLLAAVYTGQFWARVVVGLQLALGILVQLGRLYSIAHDVGFLAGFMSSWVLVIFVVCFVLLCFSPSVSMYLESHRTQRTS